MRRQKILFLLTSVGQTILLALLLWDSIQKGVPVSVAAAAAALLTGCGGNFFLFRVILLDVDGVYMENALALADYHRENDRIRKEHLQREEQQDEMLRGNLLRQIGEMETYVQHRKDRTGTGAEEFGKTVGENEEFRKITGEMEKTLQRTRRPIWCGNTLLNVLIYDKMEMAEKYGIRLDASLKIPDGLSVHPLELCSVFSNLLDNAIEAVSGVEEGKRKIVLRAAMFSGNMVIKVKNPYVRKAVNDPVRHKKDGGLHGIGLKIVKRITEEYHGGMSVKRQDGVFQIIVYLDCRKERKDAE